MHVAVMGAGCVGSYLGGRLAQAGHQVTLIGRLPLIEAVQQDGLWLKDQRSSWVSAHVDVTQDAAAAKSADAVLVTVSRVATPRPRASP